MNPDLFTSITAREEWRSGPQPLESGAYEALLARGGRLARITGALRRHPGLRLSDLVAGAQAAAHEDLATRMIHAAGIGEVGVAAWGSPDYPPHLRDAADVPLLYYQGSRDLLRTRCVALVGTRRPSADGLARAARLAGQLTAAGFTIVSGLARGIDTCAHQAALETEGRTIAVLGTPLSAVYPQENQSLQRRIAAEQLLISHVPFVLHANQPVHANREFFLQRNAIIAALSEALIVVEAGETSGSLVAARHALRQGRTLLIPDQCFRDDFAQWPGRLSAQGGIRVTNLADILNALHRPPARC